MCNYDVNWRAVKLIFLKNNNNNILQNIISETRLASRQLHFRGHWSAAHLQIWIKTWFRNTLPQVRENLKLSKLSPANSIFVPCGGWWNFFVRMNNWTVVKDSWGRMRIENKLAWFLSSHLGLHGVENRTLPSWTFSTPELTLLCFHFPVFLSGN